MKNFRLLPSHTIIHFDASLLFIAEYGFIYANDLKYQKTVLCYQKFAIL